MFQAKKWSWKRVAANLLLVPVLAGGSVAFVHAQLGKSGSGAPAMPAMPGSAAAKSAAPITAGKSAAPIAGAKSAAPNATNTKRTAPAAANSDPKQLLKDGRKALAEGRFADAQDMAQRAESYNASGKWGLFDDTPASLRKDIQSAMAKAKKTQAGLLVKQAKTLASKYAATDVERAANLDRAIQMAREAEQLHGPYSAWEFSDRADKLVKELETVRGRIKIDPTKPNNTSVAGKQDNRIPPKTGNTGNSTNTGNQQAAGAQAKKAAAIKLVADGKALADQGQFALAKAKYLEADKIGATFSPNEMNPTYALQDLNTRGASAMDRRVRDAQAFVAQKDYAKAEAALNAANEIATALGLFAKPVTEAKAALHIASGGQFGTPSPSGIASAGGQEYLVPAAPVGNTPPQLPDGTQTVYGNQPTGGGNVTAKQLFEQAEYELSKGEFDTATRLAIQAHNQGMQKEAAQLLNSIDAEKLRSQQRAADQAVANAKLAFQQKEYQRALGVLVLIDAKLLSDTAKAERDQMLSSCKAELDKAGVNTGLVTTGGMQQPESPLPPAEDPPGTARVNPPDPTSQADALRTVQAQKLRSEGLKVQSDALAAFGRGETDLAMQMLIDYSNRVRASGLDAGTIAQLVRPIEGRLDNFRMLKGQADALARQNKDKREAREMITNRGVAEEERKQEVGRYVRQYHDLVKKGKYDDAERIALQAKQLDPEDPAVSALIDLARMQRRVHASEKAKADSEAFVYNQLNNAEVRGPIVTDRDPVSVHLDTMLRARGRGSLNDAYQRPRTQAEFEIEVKLDKPITLDLRQTPLDQAIKNFQTLTGLPMFLDQRALDDERISTVQLVSFEPGAAVAAKHVLTCVLDQAGLSYVIEHDMVKITSTKKAKGRLVTKVFSVADLVTPVPNFALPDSANFDKLLNRTPLSSGKLVASGINAPGGATPFTPSGGLGGAMPTGQPSLPGELATSPGIHTGGRGGTLETSPIGGSANVTYADNTKHEQLIKLITNMIKPFSWDGQGGAGKLQYYDIGHALVVNQTADVISEIETLLEALRRLQDLSVAVEVRIVSLAESFFERMGLDFSVNIKTNNTSFEPALTSGVFRPEPFINRIEQKGVTVGLTPAGSFTPDLNVPIRATSYERGIPGFGNYPNAPGNNGGIALGLAFLNDIQVYTFMELAQGDMRSNIMQAPKLTMFNGQTATMNLQKSTFVVTSVQVISVNGQIIFVPENIPFPGPDDNIQLAIQPVVSADRRFVRMNLPITMAVQEGASVPLFPITTFITPVFEGGSQGQPIPFTQFLQQPSWTTMQINTTVVCPDGGTVLLGGLKTARESRNEFGPPFLSKIPYINRLFRNVGVGRDTRHVMIMVTPRIIITSEEEIFQTEGRLPGQ